MDTMFINCILLLLPLWCIINATIILIKKDFIGSEKKSYENATWESQQKMIIPSVITYYVEGIVLFVIMGGEFNLYTLSPSVTSALWIIMGLVIVVYFILNRKLVVRNK